jgi:hypothetical protein
LVCGSVGRTRWRVVTPWGFHKGASLLEPRPYLPVTRPHPATPLRLVRSLVGRTRWHCPPRAVWQPSLGSACGPSALSPHPPCTHRTNTVIYIHYRLVSPRRDRHLVRNTGALAPDRTDTYRIYNIENVIYSIYTIGECLPAGTDIVRNTGARTLVRVSPRKHSTHPYVLCNMRYKTCRIYYVI